MKNLILTFSISITMFSCSKSNSKGTIQDYGDPGLDGCGWVIEIGNETYTPINLDEQYKQDGLSVELEFKELSSKFHCGLGNTTYDEIEIVEIK